MYEFIHSVYVVHYICITRVFKVSVTILSFIYYLFELQLCMWYNKLTQMKPLIAQFLFFKNLVVSDTIYINNVNFSVLFLEEGFYSYIYTCKFAFQCSILSSWHWKFLRLVCKFNFCIAKKNCLTCACEQAKAVLRVIFLNGLHLLANCGFVCLCDAQNFKVNTCQTSNETLLLYASISLVTG